MSLVFGGANSDIVVVPHATSIDTLATLTWIMHIYPTTLAANLRIMQKGGNKNLEVTAAGRALWSVGRATTASTANSSDAQLVINAWQCLAVTYDSAVGANMFYGTPGAIMADVGTLLGYSSHVAGSGADSSDSAVDLGIGNRPLAPSVAFTGLIGVVAVFNRVLTLQEMQDWQKRPNLLTSGCVMLLYLGYDGVGTQTDRSGNSNNGTITGATLGTHNAPALTPAALATLLGQQGD